MIITIVADVLGEPNNGTTIAALNLVRSLTEKGHTVRVICPDKDKKEKPGYYIVPTLSVGPFQSIVDHNGVVLAKGDPMTIGRAIHDADEVHIMMPFLVGRTAVKIANRMGIPVSAGFHVQAENITAHLFNFMSSRWINAYVYRNFWKYFYQYVDAIHYPTDFIRQTFEGAIHHKTNGYVISNGVSSSFRKIDMERPDEFKNKFVILCTGRFSKEKKQSLLIKAVAESAHRAQIQIVFAGEGPRQKELQKCADRYQIKPIFRFFSRDELVKMLNCSDLYVHTSQVEIEAISCLEAISCGLIPVINDSPDSATRSFALTPNNLFKLNDSHDLAVKIDYWIDNPEAKKACLSQYSSYAGQFAFDSCMDAMEKMIIKTAQTRKRPSLK